MTTGSNGAYSAGAGYNLVTGLGTPQAACSIPDLIAYKAPINFAAETGNVTVTPATLAAGGSYSRSFDGANAVVFHALMARAGDSTTPGEAATTRSSPATMDAFAVARR